LGEWGRGLIVAGFNLGFKDEREDPSVRCLLSSLTPFASNEICFDLRLPVILSLVREADHRDRYAHGVF